MSDKQDKTFDPTPQKLNKAKEEGNVFRSKEIVSVGMLLTGMSVLFLGTPAGFGQLKVMASSVFRSATTTTVNTLSTPAIFMEVGVHLLKIIAPLFAALLVAALSLNVFQSGWNVTFKPLTPKGERINPGSGLKRIFSSRGVFEFGKAVTKIIIVGPVAYMTISSKLPEILMLHTLPIMNIIGTVTGWMMLLVAQILAILLVLSGIDFTYEKWKHKEDLKMSKQEIKDEQKDSEGDAQVKGKRLSIARERSRKPRLDHAVLNADVVVTNPTHYAVALKYDPEMSAAPMVLIKGIRKRALRIKALAAENNIPTVEDRPLARALYNTVPEQQEIPEELYPAVAALLAEIYRQREKGW